MSIVEKGNDEIAKSYINKADYSDITSFNVEFKVEFNNDTVQGDGVNIQRYVLVKENADSPWLILDWGVAF